VSAQLPWFCGHTAADPLTSRDRLTCPECGSFWDLKYAGKPFTYDAAYPKERFHFDQGIGSCKQRTLENWLTILGLELAGKAVLEVGFGAGFCLRSLGGQAKAVFGIEAIQANIEHAVSLGATRTRLFLPDTLPERLELPIDLWIFQDSFEHLEDHKTFLSWLRSNCAPRAQILLVAPDAGAPSARLLWPLWPHRVPDHQFHWSKAGVIDFLGRWDFQMIQNFHPRKHFSARTALSQIRRVCNWPWVRHLERICPDIIFTFNIGEMGILLELPPSSRTMSPSRAS